MGAPPDPLRTDETRRDSRAVHRLGDLAGRGHRSGAAPVGSDLAGGTGQEDRHGGGLCKMLTATITFRANAQGARVLAAMTALGEQLATDTRWTTGNPRIPQVVTGPWKHLVFGHPARDDGTVDRGAYIFCVLEQFCRHLKHREIYAETSTRYRNPQARLLDGPGVGGGQG